MHFFYIFDFELIWLFKAHINFEIIRKWLNVKSKISICVFFLV